MRLPTISYGLYPQIIRYDYILTVVYCCPSPSSIVVRLLYFQTRRRSGDAHTHTHSTLPYYRFIILYKFLFLYYYYYYLSMLREIHRSKPDATIQLIRETNDAPRMNLHFFDFFSIFFSPSRIFLIIALCFFPIF